MDRPGGSYTLRKFYSDEREGEFLAPYAMHGMATAGRKHAEPDHPYRGPFQRDRDRIVHSSAYRRLSYKTQVFTGELGDYHRTRLTHTLEVASVARTVGRALRLNEDLIEALALLHDIGHPPFGHAGEQVLDRCLAQKGGFEHNRQALRIVEYLERRYPEFFGLNLSLEVLEGQEYRADKPTAGPQPPLEVQVVDTADSVGYVTHDADDALQLGLLDPNELLEIPLWRAAVDRVRRKWTDLEADDLRRAVIHELIDWQVSDLLEGALRRLNSGGIDSVEAVRSAGKVIRPSAELAERKTELERFLFDRVYRHPDVMAVRQRAQQWLEEMFQGYLASPALLPGRYREIGDQDGLERAVGDYLAGMTDRFAQQQLEQNFR
jgi:dGTPase